VRLDRSVCLDDLIGSITEIDRIDERTAQYVALRLGEPDADPANDDCEPGAAEHWRPWRALAATHRCLVEGSYEHRRGPRGAT